MGGSAGDSAVGQGLLELGDASLGDLGSFKMQLLNTFQPVQISGTSGIGRWYFSHSITVLGSTF